MKKKSAIFAASLIIISLIFLKCTDDEDGDKNGTLTIKLTDAPSDDLNISGTYITISDVKIDGEPIERFSKQTIEISAYQQGETKILTNERLEPGMYNSVSLVLNYKTDESGDFPGCYVLTTNNNVHNLAAESQTQSEMTFINVFEVQPNSESSWVVDFDLRKAIVREIDSSTESDYKFVSSAEMQKAFRIVEEKNTGTISGRITDEQSLGNNIYIYAYRKDEFTETTEIGGQGPNNVRFANAVTSSGVAEDGTFNLAFLQQGNYEIILVDYEIVDGKSNFRKILISESQTTGYPLDNVLITGESIVNLDIKILESF